MPKRSARSRTQPKLRVKIVPETHWDRAWYIPFEDFRISLVRLIDNILDTVESQRDYTTFCLDGQTVVIEDFLEIKPQERDRLERAVKADRLKIGPWYVLPDEFLVSGEALVRNLLIGREIAESLGRSMNVGYVPDPFGHIGQLPQILNGFGIDSFIFSRGLINDEWKKGIEFTWKATDGSEVLALWQKDFYNNAAFLGYHLVWGDAERHIFNPERAQEQLESATHSLSAKTKGRTVLLNNGVDHSDIQAELPSIVAEARKRHPEWEISIAGFDDYVRAIKKDLAGKRLKTHKGEVTYPYGDLLIGVYSSRMYLKQQNAECQTLLERYAEPLSAIARVAGHGEDSRPFLAYAWRQLLRNHPHDDICGCSVNQVHRDMEHRFASTRHVGRSIAGESLRRLAHRLDHSGQTGIPHVIFNPTAGERSEVQRLKILFNQRESDEARRFGLVDSEGDAVPFVEVERRSEDWMESCKGFHFDAVETLTEAKPLPGVGVTTLYAQPGKRGKRPTKRVKTTARGLENEWLKVQVKRNGTYDVTDKTNGTIYRGLGLLEDMEDVGDAYNWSYAKHGSRVTSRGSQADLSIVEKTPLSGVLEVTVSLRVPRRIDEDRKKRSDEYVELILTSRLELLAGARRLNVETRFENNAEDHRLRVLFPTDLVPQTVQVDGHFDVVERSTVAPGKREWVGKPMKPTMTHSQKGFVDLTDGQRGLAVLNVGLPEYEIVPEKKGHTIALTLMRSVGWISRGDFASRPGNAGPEVAASEAQCLRPFTFRYAVMPHEGDWSSGGVMAEAQALNAPVQVVRADLHAGTVFEDVPGDIFPIPEETYMTPIPREGELPPHFSIVDLQPGNLVLSTCKTAQNRDETVVRFYNPENKKVRGQVAFGLPVKRIRRLALDETALPKAKGGENWKDNEIRLSIPAHGIVTLGVTFA